MGLSKNKKSKKKLKIIKKVKKEVIQEVPKQDNDSKQLKLSKKEMDKLKKRLADKNQKHMESVQQGKKELNKHKKSVQKLERRLKDKNRKMMEVSVTRKKTENELHDTSLALKDMERLLKHKDDSIAELKHKLEYEYNLELAQLKEKLYGAEKKLKGLNIERAKKDTVIELLEKPEFDYSQLIDFDIKHIKTRHTGYPEVAQIEEISFDLRNIMSEPINNLVCDVVIENENRRIELNDLQVKPVLNPKEKLVKTLHIYKHLRSRGIFKVTVWVRQRGQKVALVEQSKTINI
jgi:chromosome segregation ATPase